MKKNYSHLVFYFCLLYNPIFFSSLLATTHLGLTQGIFASRTLPTNIERETSFNFVAPFDCVDTVHPKNKWLVKFLGESMKWMITSAENYEPNKTKLTFECFVNGFFQQTSLILSANRTIVLKNISKNIKSADLICLNDLVKTVDTNGSKTSIKTTYAIKRITKFECPHDISESTFYKNLEYQELRLKYYWSTFTKTIIEPRNSFSGRVDQLYSPENIFKILQLKIRSFLPPEDHTTSRNENNTNQYHCTNKNQPNSFPISNPLDSKKVTKVIKNDTLQTIPQLSQVRQDRSETTKTVEEGTIIDRNALETTTTDNEDMPNDCQSTSSNNDNEVGQKCELDNNKKCLISSEINNQEEFDNFIKAFSKEEEIACVQFMNCNIARKHLNFTNCRFKNCAFSDILYLKIIDSNLENCIFQGCTVRVTFDNVRGKGANTFQNCTIKGTIANSTCLINSVWKANARLSAHITNSTLDKSKFVCSFIGKNNLSSKWKNVSAKDMRMINSLWTVSCDKTIDLSQSKWIMYGDPREFDHKKGPEDPFCDSQNSEKQGANPHRAIQNKNYSDELIDLMICNTDTCERIKKFHSYVKNASRDGMIVELYFVNGCTPYVSFSLVDINPLMMKSNNMFVFIQNTEMKQHDILELVKIQNKIDELHKEKLLYFEEYNEDLGRKTQEVIFLKEIQEKLKEDKNIEDMLCQLENMYEIYKKYTRSTDKVFEKGHLSHAQLNERSKIVRGHVNEMISCEVKNYRDDKSFTDPNYGRVIGSVLNQKLQALFRINLRYFLSYIHEALRVAPRHALYQYTPLTKKTEQFDGNVDKIYHDKRVTLCDVLNIFYKKNLLQVLKKITETEEKGERFKYLNDYLNDKREINNDNIYGDE